MATYSDWEQAKLDQSYTNDDRPRGDEYGYRRCSECGGYGRIYWGYGGERGLRVRPCASCAERGWLPLEGE